MISWNDLLFGISLHIRTVRLLQESIQKKKITHPDDDDAFQLNVILTVIWSVLFGGCPQKVQSQSGDVNVINALLECNALCMLTLARHMTNHTI